jgi:hypothetical protein
VESSLKIEEHETDPPERFSEEEPTKAQPKENITKKYQMFMACLSVE